MTVNRTTAARMLRPQLRDAMAAIGFSGDAKLFFRRSQGSQEDSICVCINRAMSGEGVGITLMMGIRYPDIESVLAREDRDPTIPTISAPIHFLTESRDYFEWPMKDESQVGAVVAAIMDGVATFALPYFKHFGARDTLRSTLEARDDRIILQDPVQRAGVLAAIALLAGDRERAKSVFVAEAAHPQNAHWSAQERIRELSHRMLKP